MAWPHGMNFCRLGQDAMQWWAVVNAVMSLRVIQKTRN
jgi:hypothetical protein